MVLIKHRRVADLLLSIEYAKNFKHPNVLQTTKMKAIVDLLSAKIRYHSLKSKDKLQHLAGKIISITTFDSYSMHPRWGYCYS